MRIRDGKRLVQDGPFADAKEQLGGYFVIEVPDLDAALEWAARAVGVDRLGRGAARAAAEVAAGRLSVAQAPTVAKATETAAVGQRALPTVVC